MDLWVLEDVPTACTKIILSTPCRVSTLIILLVSCLKMVLWIIESLFSFSVDGSVNTLLEHCLGLKTEHQDTQTKIDNDVSRLTCPLLRYLATCDTPSTSHVSLLCSQYGCDVTSASGQGPLHVYLTSHVTSVSLSLVSQLVEAGVKLDQRDEDGNTPLLCLSHLLDRGQMAVAAQIAQFLCTQPGCDVNSGNEQNI